MRGIWWLFAGVVAQSACSDSPGPEPVKPAGVAIGSGQHGLVGDPLPFPLIVSVTKDGRAIPGQAVTWAVASGSGTFSAPGGATDSLGIAKTTFTPGVAGAHRVTADIGGTALVSFDATAVVNRPPTEVAVVLAEPGHFIHDTFVRDGIAFACSWNNGLILYDVGNGIKGASPAHPIEISRVLTAANGVAGGIQVHNAWWFHNPVKAEQRYVFVGQEGPGVIGASSAGDIHVVDVSDLVHPVEVGFVTVAGAGTHNFWMDEARQILYAAYYNAGVVAVDVSGTLAGDLSSRIIAQATPGGAGSTYTWGVQLSGGSLWSIDMLTGLWKLDPATLATRGGGNNVPNRLSSDFSVRGNFAYTGTFPGKGQKGDHITVWQIDGASPVLRDSLRLPDVNLVSDLQASDDGRILVATAQSAGTSGLWVFSLADPAHPVLIGRTAVSVNLHTGQLAEIGGRLYVFAARVSGATAMQIWDVTP